MSFRDKCLQRKQPKKNRLIKTEPDDYDRIGSITAQEAIVNKAKKCLIDINKQLGYEQSFSNYKKQISADSALAQWNNHQISSNDSLRNIFQRQKSFSFSKELEIQSKTKESVLSRKMNLTFVRNKNIPQIKKKYSLNSYSKSKSIIIPSLQQIEIKSPIKYIQMKQIKINLQIPKKHNQSLTIKNQTQVSFYQKSCLINKNKQRKREARIQRLYGAHAQEHANKYNYIFKNPQSKKIKLPIRSLLKNEITKIHRLIREQNINYYQL